jgi:hypothetical protein
MARLYWKVKVNGKWTWRPVHWLAYEYIKDDNSRLIRVYDWQGGLDNE